MTKVERLRTPFLMIILCLTIPFFPNSYLFSAEDEKYCYKEIQQVMEGKDYISALNLAQALPEEEEFYLSGILKEKSGSYQEAIEFFQKYLEKSKLLADYSLFHIANNYYWLGKFLEAALWYEKAEILFDKKSTSSSQILERLAKSYEKLNYFEGAIKTYQRLGNDKALFDLATLYKGLGREEEAVETFWRLVKNFPNSPLSVRAVNQLESLQTYLSPEEKFSLAYVFYLNGLYREAEKRFLLLLNQEIPSSLSSKIHYLRGKSLFWLWDYEGALKEYRQVYPENKEISYARGCTLQKLRRYEEAINEYEKIGNSESLWQMSRCYRELKDYAKAIGALEKILSFGYAQDGSSEEQSRAAYFSGKYWEKLEKNERASATYSRVAKLPYTFYYYRACQEGKIAPLANPTTFSSNLESPNQHLTHSQLPPLTNHTIFSRNMREDSHSMSHSQQLSPPEKQNFTPLEDSLTRFTQEDPPPQQNLSDLEKRPELKRTLFLLKLGIREEAIEELKNLERKSQKTKEEILTLFYLYQEVHAYPRAICLGTLLKNRKLRYPLYYQDLVEGYSKKYNLDPFLVFSMIWQESRFGKEDISSASAIGLMQIIPSTGAWIARRMRWQNYQTTSLFEPETNITFGCYYFRHLLNSFDNNIILALCAYNAGPKNISNWFSKEDDLDEFVESIPFSETYNYVKRVISAYQEYQSLYGVDYG